MQKNELIETLGNAYDDFTQKLSTYSNDELHFSLQGKWSAVQQAQHLYKSVRPVRFAFLLSVFFLKILFGKANRVSKTYDEILAKYHKQLSNGGSASTPFIPTKDENIKTQKVLQAIETNIVSLKRSIQKKTENDLDFYILPHPLLGKITLREMLYFTIIHVKHHQENIIIQLSEMNDSTI